MADAPALDFDDPCAVLAGLKKAKTELLLGMKEVRIRFRNGDDEQEVQFQTASVSELDQAIKEYTGLCTANGGDPGPQVRRFAIRFGARRRG